MASNLFRRCLLLAPAIVAMALVAAPVEAQYSGDYTSAWGGMRLEESNGQVVGFYTAGPNGLPGTITGELKQRMNLAGEPYWYVQGTFRDDVCVSGGRDLWWPLDSGDVRPNECAGTLRIDFLYHPDTSEFLAEYQLFDGNTPARAFWGTRMPAGEGLDHWRFDS